jgi:hypothetical protein
MKEPGKTILGIIGMLSVATVVVFGMQYCNNQSLEQKPREVIIKHRIQENHDSVWYQVTVYKRDTTYQEVVPKMKKSWEKR